MEWLHPAQVPNLQDDEALLSKGHRIDFHRRQWLHVCQKERGGCGDFPREICLKLVAVMKKGLLRSPRKKQLSNVIFGCIYFVCQSSQALFRSASFLQSLVDSTPSPWRSTLWRKNGKLDIQKMAAFARNWPFQILSSYLANCGSYLSRF